MLWSAGNNIKAEEDRNHSLLKILGIHMSVLYGKGADNVPPSSEMNSSSKVNRYTLVVGPGIESIKKRQNSRMFPKYCE